MDRIALALIVAAFATCAHADPLQLTLIPTSGDVGGAPGAAVGWGFTLTDTAGDYVVLADSYFVGSPVYGSYQDYISSALYVAGPSPESSTVVEAWNQASQLGVGEFDLFATDPANTVIPGTIFVDYDLFSEDPNSPNFDPGSFVASGTFSDPVQIEVTPEPSSWMLISVPLVFFMLAGWRRQVAGRS
jgi:hypothetical protein